MVPVDTEPATATPAAKGFFFTDSIRRTVLLSLLLAVATAGVYFRAHTCTFFSLDDGFYVVDNPNVHHGVNWTTIRWAFSAFDRQNWIPLSFLSHALDYQLFGSDPAGHHLVNVIFHTLNVVLLFWVLKRATGATGRSYAVAALWALHPLNVEAVLWVAERKTVLSMMFFLLAIGAYEWYAREPREGRYWLVALLYALGLTAKAQIITLPVLLLLWDYWPLQRIGFGFGTVPSAGTSTSRYPAKSLGFAIKEKIPLLVIGFVVALYAVWANGAARGHHWLPFTARLANGIFSYARYVRKLFWPSDLAPLYPNLGSSLATWQVLAASLVLVAITILVLLQGRKYRYLPMGWFWFLIALIPMLQVFQFGREGMADRFVYQAMIGLLIMICWGVSDWAQRLSVSPAWLASATAVFVLAFGVITYRQIGYWSDPSTMWIHAIQVVPNDYIAESQLGNELVKQDRPEEAMPHFFRAVEIDPNEALSNIRIGIYEQKHGNPQDAIARYQRVLRENSLVAEEEANVYLNLSIAYSDLGDIARSHEYADKAASLRGN